MFDPKFLEEVANMKEKNLAVELLKKLIAEQVSVYRRTNIVKSEKFSEIMQRSLNAYLNGMLTNEEVIEEMLKLAKQIAAAQKRVTSSDLQPMNLHSTMPSQSRRQSKIFTKMTNSLPLRKSLPIRSAETRRLTGKSVSRQEQKCVCLSKSF